MNSSLVLASTSWGVEVGMSAGSAVLAVISKRTMEVENPDETTDFLPRERVGREGLLNAEFLA